MKRIIIIGAGEAGRMVSNEIINNKKLYGKYEIAGFFDDKKTGTLNGIKILGKVDSIRNVSEVDRIDEIIIAIPSATKTQIENILKLTEETDIPTRIVPGIFEIIEGGINWRQIRPVKPEDLLGREEVGLDIERLTSFFKDKTIFVTGGGGSIGSEIIRNTIKLPVKKVIAFGRGENSIHNLLEEFRFNEKFDFIIGNIKDKSKLDYEIKKHSPDIVFHAAAHKHLPLMEKFPDESIKNNILGTYNVALSSIKNGINNFIMISTDKAVNPTSIMGATKKIAEKIILSFNEKKAITRFSVVRFGNVLGSRGSVIPAFMRQIENGGPVLVTHKDIERFFMSIPEAAKLVIQAADANHGGQIYILDMGRPIKILDLAKNMIKMCGFSETEIPIKFSGLRKGEKMYEELSRGKTRKSAYDKILISEESTNLYNPDCIEQIINDFKEASETYNSDIIKNLIKKYIPEYTGAFQEI